ncbi:STAS domain-containing protein [Micromonospora sp. C28SCA-DRY-2]|uniref:STAS domain-containing protein n=1 Tax=Micromonospora sp. C28SCA-DRY-2 TaxID=3059522 RepID=UPI0026751C6D|nr:STAS domain-containing protein [Micromonospora sp. C28SCA-DRY-2]MDO3702985.1 STAS domain-containing protein [Micromonospora sp. C28SCA-DRY-2]
MTQQQAGWSVPLIEVALGTELDRAGLSVTGPVFDRVLALSPGHVVVNLAGCRHVDAAGIGLLLDVHRRLARRQAVLSLRDPNPRIRRILQTARLDQVLPVTGSGPPAAPLPDAPPPPVGPASPPAGTAPPPAGTTPLPAGGATRSSGPNGRPCGRAVVASPS